MAISIFPLHRTSHNSHFTARHIILHYYRDKQISKTQRKHASNRWPRPRAPDRFPVAGFWSLGLGYGPGWLLAGSSPRIAAAAAAAVAYANPKHLPHQLVYSRVDDRRAAPARICQLHSSPRARHRVTHFNRWLLHTADSRLLADLAFARPTTLADSSISIATATGHR